MNDIERKEGRKKIYIKTDMVKMPNGKEPCNYLIKKWDIEFGEFSNKCGLSMPLFSEIVDCCEQNCPLVVKEEV